MFTNENHTDDLGVHSERVTPDGTLPTGADDRGEAPHPLWRWVR